MASVADRLKHDEQYKKLLELGMRDPHGLRKRMIAEKCSRRGGLLHFVRFTWKCVEPDRQFVENWHIEAICDHLEAVTFGEIKRLLINVPPGFMKSLLLNVFWPAWEWGPLGRTSTRYIAASYSQDLTVRDNVKFRQIIMSPEYQELWGTFGPGLQFNLEKVGNDKTGWKLATSVGGVGTGERADRVIIDDPNSVKEAESDRVRDTTNQWFREVVPTRLNEPKKSAILVIQQRTHEEDVSGVIIKAELPYVHLMIPMRYDATRRYTTPIGWTDPRGLDDNGDPSDEADGELAWEEFFPEDVVASLETTLGPYAAAGQFQQAPVPRGGAIFERQWWQPWWWVNDGGKVKRPFPKFDYIVGSIDTAYTEKEENDYSALTIWGVFHDEGETLTARGAADPNEVLRISKDQRPKVLLMYGWQKRLPLHGPPDARPQGMAREEWNSPFRLAERQKKWGLVEWVVYEAKRYQVDQLLIETQAVGHTLQQELRRLHSGNDWGVTLIPAKGDKVARAIAVQHLFSNGLVYVPTFEDTQRNPSWAEEIVDQFASFPKTRHKDLVDSGTHALQHLRDTGVLVRKEEYDREFEKALQWQAKPKALYDV